jgi:hypothetical protein
MAVDLYADKDTHLSRCANSTLFCTQTVRNIERCREISVESWRFITDGVIILTSELTFCLDSDKCDFGKSRDHSYGLNATTIDLKSWIYTGTVGSINISTVLNAHCHKQRCSVAKWESTMHLSVAASVDNVTVISIGLLRI